MPCGDPFWVHTFLKFWRQLGTSGMATVGPLDDDVQVLPLRFYQKNVSSILLVVPCPFHPVHVNIEGHPFGAPLPVRNLHAELQN